MTERRLLATLAVLALVVSSVAAVGVGVAVDSEDGHVRVNQQDDGGLLVEFDNETFPDRQGVTVNVTANNETTTLDTSAAETDDPDWWAREVAADALPDGSLADARVTVAYNGTVEFDRTMDLRHLRVETGTARFDDAGRLAVNATSVGLGGGAVDVQASPNAGGSETLSGSIENGVLRFDRGQIQPLLLPPANVTLSATADGPKVAADGRIDFREVGETSVSLQSGGVLVSSDLLVDGQQYHVTLATEDPEATYVVTANASEGRIELSNEYVTGAGDVTVELDGDTVLNAGFQPPEAVRGSVVDGNVSVEGDLPGGSIDRAVLDDGSSVRLLDNVTQESGTVSLPVTLSPNGSYSLVLLYGDGSSVFVEVGDGGSSPPASEGTATSEQTEGGLIQSLGGNNVLVGALLTLAVLLGVVVAMLWLTSDDDDDGAANGGATGSRELRVSVIDGYNDSQITGAVTVEATPQKQQTKEGYRLDTSGRTHEITGGTSRIEVPRKPVELEATYNGISTSRTVRLAESDGVQLRFGPVPQTLTVRDEDGEPIPGATVAIVSDGQTHVTRETDEAGRAHFDVSVDATGFEVAVEHDRFESASRHVADPSSFPDSITLAEKTGTLRVRTAIDGEATDAVDLRIRAAEGTRSEAAPTVEASTEPGIYEFQDVPVGAYELLATADGSPFDPDRETVEIGADDAVTADLDVGFRFSIDRHRDELAALRTAADELVPSSQIDTAIHGYYASVAHALADVVESLPERGDQFAGTGVDPDAVAEALLDTGQGVVTVVDNALNTKQNVDLFNGCADLPAATVEWDGFEITTLFDLAGKEQMLDQQTEIRTRLTELEERIDAERDELNVVSPASDVLDELRNFAQNEMKSDTTRNAAVVFVLLGFADAVEELFEREQLRERLQYTRF